MRSSKDDIDTLPVKLPLTAMGLLIPNITVINWVGKGINFLEDMVEESRLKSFQQLQNEYCLPISEQYTFMQICYLWRNTLNLSTWRDPEVLSGFLHFN